MSDASAIGLYVPIVLALFAVFLYFVLRRRRPRDTDIVESGDAQRLER